MISTRVEMTEASTEAVRSFTREAMVRGYHIYNSIWEAYIGEELSCQRDEDNEHDPYAVAVLKSATIVGHLPRKVSTLCSLFIRRGGTIHCRITGRRRYSADLPQGGLEVPCRLQFEGSVKESDKLQRSLDSFCGKDAQLQDDIDTKDSAVEASDQISSNVSTTSQELQAAKGNVDLTVSPEKKRLKVDSLHDCDMEKNILDGNKLTDIPINKALGIIKQQFPNIQGLQSTLLQYKGRKSVTKDQVQVIHDRGDHWIVASNVGCKRKEVNIYDSVYSSVNKETEKVVFNIFTGGSKMTINMRPFQKQSGGADCGLFALAAVTALAFNIDPSILKLNQEVMRQHLVTCLHNQKFTLFPTDELY